MSLEALDKALERELEGLKVEGRAKPAERVIVGVIPPAGARGPRYRLQGSEREFIRMNSNSYLSLSLHPELIAAADEATRQFGVGPGAVRFIDGTFAPHAALEERIARFMGMPAAKIFNSAYTANCGLALAIASATTYWIGDQLNHNSIIRAMRIAGVPSANKAIYPHNDMAALAGCIAAVPADMQRVVVIFDGVFSMRGDYAPVDQIAAVVRPCGSRFKEGIVTVMDDSHGIGAFGPLGRGTADHTGSLPDIVIGTFGKAFGVNGGFIAAKPGADRGRPPEGGHVYLHQPAECRRLRRGPAGGRSVRRPGRPIAPGPRAGHGGALSPGDRNAGLAVHPRPAPDRPPAGARHTPHPRPGAASVQRGRAGGRSDVSRGPPGR